MGARRHVEEQRLKSQPRNVLPSASGRVAALAALFYCHAAIFVVLQYLGERVIMHGLLAVPRYTPV